MKAASLYEYLSSYSVENLFAYLRFQAFPDVTNDRMKELLLEAISVPCRENDILTRILNYAETKDFDGLLQYLKLNQVSMDQVERPLKNPEEMLDIFLSETTEHNAARALKVLLRFPIYDNDITAYTAFVKKWPEIKDPSIKEDTLQLFDYTEIII